ncbi:MAG: hypothetical protein MJZ48_01570 [Paludibacteraceae bacterium]|nr:hypothetical protein [Paludibacteraceae bacterium]
MRKWCIFILLFIARLAYGQFSDEQLYQAYMQGNLTLWGQYIDAQDWDKLTHNERKRLINYEYGYIPFLADQKRMQEAAKYLVSYQQHLACERAYLSKADYTAYLSAASAYAYLLDKSKLLSEGMQSFKLAKQAVEFDPHNVIAMTLKGNVDFYAPKLFGGNKQKAIEMFLEAEKLMEQDPNFYYLWNLPAMQLAIAQCYDKLGNTNAAMQQVNKILTKHPNFKYVKQTYLPELKQKKQKK